MTALHKAVQAGALHAFVALVRLGASLAAKCEVRRHVHDATLQACAYMMRRFTIAAGRHGAVARKMRRAARPEHASPGTKGVHVSVRGGQQHACRGLRPALQRGRTPLDLAASREVAAEWKKAARRAEPLPPHLPQGLVVVRLTALSLAARGRVCRLLCRRP